MASQQVVRVRGADKVSRTMKAAARDLTTMDAATEEYATLVARTAKGNAPVRTGALRASIIVSGQQILATVGYAAPVEFGSRRRGIPPSRYMGRAVENTEDDRDRIYTADADKICDQIKGV